MQHSLSPITADFGAGDRRTLTRPVPDILVNIAHIGKVKRRQMGAWARITTATGSKRWLRPWGYY
jgi:hypothetical protein